MTGNMLARIGMLIIAGIAGAVYGVVGTVAHASTLWGLPVGLVLGLIGVAALILAIRLLADRWAAAAAGIGLTIAIIVFSGVGPGGSIIAPEGALALVWTLSCPLIAALIVAWPQLDTLFDGRGAEASPADTGASPADV